jgi:ankyrin repeat protein
MNMNVIRELCGDDRLYGRDIHNITPLMTYCFKNDIVKIITLLESSSVDVNEVDENLQTALILASKYSKIEIIKELLKRNAFREAKDMYGRTFMYYLSEERKKIICDYIEELDSVIVKPAKH